MLQEGLSGQDRIAILTVHPVRFSDPMDHVDDEYSRAGVHDPKILLTTSRDPSSKLQQFSKVRSFHPRCLKFYLDLASDSKRDLSV